MKKSLASSLFDKLRGRVQERHTRNVSSLRDLIVLLGDSERKGVKVQVDDLDSFAEVVEAEGYTEDDLRACVDRYLERVRHSELAAQAAKLKQQASEAEKAFRDADLEEGRRRREAQLRIRQLEEALQRAIGESNTAMAAEADLVASAELPAAYWQLCEEQRDVNRRLQAVELQLDPRDSHERPGHMWGDVQRQPARLAKQARTELAKLSKAARSDPDRRKKCKSMLEAAEAGIAVAEKEKAKLIKERDCIAAKMAKFHADRLLPENFQLKRARPTREEAAKARAAQLGFHPEPVQ